MGNGSTSIDAPSATASPPRVANTAFTAAASSSRDAPTATTLWQSWATLEAMAPRESPIPWMKAVAMGAGA